MTNQRKAKGWDDSREIESAEGTGSLTEIAYCTSEHQLLLCVVILHLRLSLCYL